MTPMSSSGDRAIDRANRPHIHLYGSLAGLVEVSFMEGVGPRGAGLIVCEVDSDARRPSAPTATFALDPGGADQLAGALEWARRQSAAMIRAGKASAPNPEDEVMLLRDRGLPAGPLNDAFKAGRLGVTPASHVPGPGGEVRRR